jgi:hypothetical protein
LVKKLFDKIFLGQFLPKPLEGDKIRDRLVQGESDKPSKAESVDKLIF